ncbi:hypothetical protein MN116_008473 [Schistosoma mekongi]|uniref:Uncharacterized protein n=1 Tax=Schistosoma mekongi TaxID=38744 RepID=A0AAE2D190_SCHME|nr:hypothetical protein MN116_008473 [Schistosoma mekongi]
MPKRCPLQWISAANSTIGPLLQNHAGAIVKGVFYLHGGITVNATLCIMPSNCFYKIQIYPHVGQWVEITSSDSPTLSQHACLVFKDRYLIFIVRRISDLFAKLPVKSEPVPSSIIVNVTIWRQNKGVLFNINPDNFIRYIVLFNFLNTPFDKGGWNGRIRTPGDLIDADSPQQQMKYVYYEADSSLTASSRSYHTSTAITPCTLITIGGCKSNSFDLLKWKIIHKSKKEQYNWPGPLDYPLISCSAVTDFVKNIEQQKLDLIQLAPSHQNGWRGHCVVPGVGGIFIGTGESFDALKHGPLNSAYLLKYDDIDNNVKPTIYEIGTIDEPRAYSVTSICRIDGTAWLHGGLGPNGKIMGTLMKLIKVE